MNEGREPGESAPTTGHYEELNIFGSPTGRVEHVGEGEPLPNSPIGHTWRTVPKDSARD